MSDAEWAREGTHSESGRYTVERWLEIYAQHAHGHADERPGGLVEDLHRRVGITLVRLEVERLPERAGGERDRAAVGEGRELRFAHADMLKHLGVPPARV